MWDTGKVHALLSLFGTCLVSREIRSSIQAFGCRNATHGLVVAVHHKEPVRPGKSVDARATTNPHRGV